MSGATEPPSPEGPSSTDAGEVVAAVAGRPKVRAVIAISVAVACALCALALFLRRRDDLGQAIDAMARASPWLVALAIALPLINWLSTTGAFWILTRRIGRVGLGEMAALMGASWLANYMPLKPGLVGRIAYHQRVNGIPIGASARVVVEAVALSAIAAAALLCLVFLAQDQFLGRGAAWLGCSLWLVCAIWSAVHSRALREADRSAGQPPGWISTWVAALAFRLADGGVWIVRYLVAFKLVGASVTPLQAAALAAVSQAVAALPVLGSALGVREWAVALVASALPSAALTAGDGGSSGSGGGAEGVGGAGGASMLSAGLVADILNRAIEVGLALVVGLASSAWVARRIAVFSPGPSSVGGVRGAPEGEPPARSGVHTIIGSDVDGVTHENG